MKPVKQLCKTLIYLNDLWDKTPETIKPIASGSAIILALLLHKIIIGIGVLIFFGSRTAYKMEICTKVSNEKNKTKK